MKTDTIEAGFVLDAVTIGQMVYLLNRMSSNEVCSSDRQLAVQLLPSVDSIKCRVFYPYVTQAE